MIGGAKLAGFALRYGPTIALVIVGTGGLWWAYDWAYDRGYNTRTAEVQEATEKLERELKEVSDRLSVTLRDIEIERAARERLIEEVENDARNDPAAGRLALPADSVQRVRRRWGTAD